MVTKMGFEFRYQGSIPSESRITDVNHSQPGHLLYTIALMMASF